MAEAPASPSGGSHESGEHNPRSTSESRIGFRMAAKCARNALLQKVVDNKADAEKFRLDLMNIAMTTLSSKILSQDKEHFAKLAVDAVMRLKKFRVKLLQESGGQSTLDVLCQVNLDLVWTSIG